LYHFAVRYPRRRDLADAVRRVREAQIPLHGATDHGVSESVYLADPDGNGVELTWDRPVHEWPLNAVGEPDMFSGKALDIAALLHMTEQ
jgi:catechol 2,3-dioxygenase